MKNIIVFFLSIITLPIMAQQSRLDSDSISLNSSQCLLVTKELADEAYASSDYPSAINMYEELLVTQGESASVYYNLGNCYYKEGKIAYAILNYERALLMNPGDGDVRFNLELARSKTIDKITSIREVFFVSWAKNFVALQGSDSWAFCGIVFFLLSLVGIFLYLWMSHLIVRKVGFIMALFCIFSCIVVNWAAYYQRNLRQNQTWAIVVAPSVTAKSTPATSGTELFVVHEGLKVEIKDNTMKRWREIRLSDGNVGWIPSDAIELIVK